jgi:hypothetical protein
VAAARTYVAFAASLRDKICGFMCKPFPYSKKLQNQYFDHSTPHGKPLSSFFV